MDRRPPNPAPGRVPLRDHARGRAHPARLRRDRIPGLLQRCRDRFPSLRILSGVELSEPHWHGHAAAELLAHGDFDRVLGSVHTVRTGDGRYLPADGAYREWPATEVLWEYLAEVTRMIEQTDSFMILARIDYPVRTWPLSDGPHGPCAYEADYGAALRALAHTGSALEVNTRVPLDPHIVRWWREEGDKAARLVS